MTHAEMTIAEVLKDALIRQMMRADRISVRQMKKLLEEKRDTASRPQPS